MQHQKNFPTNLHMGSTCTLSNVPNKIKIQNSKTGYETWQLECCSTDNTIHFSFMKSAQTQNALGAFRLNM